LRQEQEQLLINACHGIGHAEGGTIENSHELYEQNICLSVPGNGDFWFVLIRPNPCEIFFYLHRTCTNPMQLFLTDAVKML